MSRAPDSPAEIIHVISSVITQSRISIAAAIVFAYEYVITFDQEVSLFWMRKKTGATWLFLLIRYMALVSVCILNAATYIPMSDEVRAMPCLLLNKVQVPIQIAEYFPWALFSGMRALALSGMNWTFAAIVFTLAVVPFAANVWIISLGVLGSNFPIVGCGGGSNATKRDTLIGNPLSRSCAIAADILVIAATWRYAFKGGVFNRDMRGVTPSRLANVLLYNGTIYFLALIALNVTHLTLTLLSIVQLDNPVSEVSIFTDPLTAILIGRYLMALQSANQQVLGHKSTSSQSGEDADADGANTLRFAPRIIGSIGATLTMRDEEDALEWQHGDEEVGDEEKVHDGGVHEGSETGIAP